MACKPPRTKQGAFDQLQEFLAHEVVAGRTPLLLLDEAQDLRNSIRADRDMLGMIKTLTNLMLENERLIQIILFGQLELIPLLKKRRELMSRVAQFGVLSPLTKEDAMAMMEHRWKTAGGKLPLPFEEEALELIYQATKGLAPRYHQGQQFGPHPCLCQPPAQGQPGERPICHRRTPSMEMASSRERRTMSNKAITVYAEAMKRQKEEENGKPAPKPTRESTQVRENPRAMSRDLSRDKSRAKARATARENPTQQRTWKVT